MSCAVDGQQILAEHDAALHLLGTWVGAAAEIDGGTFCPEGFPMCFTGCNDVSGIHHSRHVLQRVGTPAESQVIATSLVLSRLDENLVVVNLLKGAAFASLDVDGEAIGHDERLVAQQAVGRIEPVARIVGMLARWTRDTQHERHRLLGFDGHANDVSLWSTSRHDMHRHSIVFIVGSNSACQQVEFLVDIGNLGVLTFIDEEAQVTQVKTMRIGTQPIGSGGLTCILLRIHLL